MISFYSTGQCPLCLTEIPDAEAVCSRCREILEKARLSSSGRCTVCFHQRKGNECTNCRGKIIFYDSHQALYRLNRPWSLVLHRWKFENEKGIGRYFHSALERLPESGLPSVDEVCYIDSGRSGFDVRAYQPCMEPAMHLAEILNKDVSSPIRKESRFRQSHRNRQKRYEGLMGRFSAGKNLQKKRILLLEDVFTTGATANECSRLLKNAGASEVHLICLLMREEYD